MTRAPIWLWLNLLSLDAPLIALLWQDVFARDAGVSISVASRASLCLTVWLVYLCDRLLDTRTGMPVNFTARHAFYCAHRRPCIALSGFVFAGLCISVSLLPRPVFHNGLLVSGAVALYFLIVHCAGGGIRKWLPKEAAVGFLFSVGTTLVPFTWTSNEWRLLLPGLLFGILCWVNSSAIEVWEGGTVDRISAWAVGHMKVVVFAISLICLLSAIWLPWRHAATALLVTAIGYWLVDNSHKEADADAVRVGIDVPLLAPLLFLKLH